MESKVFDGLLRETLNDGKLTRKESSNLKNYLNEIDPDENELAKMRSMVFRVAEENLREHNSKEVLTWVQETLKSVEPREKKTSSKLEVFFGPDKTIRTEILHQINITKKSIDICVFNITEDEYYDALIRAKKDRGVIIRVITDDEKVDDSYGNDSRKLKENGILVKVDSSEQHMHHKFAVFDGRALVSGSTNWTHAGWKRNYENIIVSDDERLVGPHGREFERLWRLFGFLG
ncbi:MAG: endonuclease [bacterium]|nr:endonuclease [bacterium]